MSLPGLFRHSLPGGTIRSHFGPALVAALLVFSSPLEAQNRGVWVSVGLGPGLQRITCEICRANGNGGWAGRVAAGGSVGRQFGWGGEFHGWTDRTDNVRFIAYSIMPALYWHPKKKPYFVMGGAGLASYRASDGNEVISSASVGMTFGGGIQLPLVARFSLTPYATYTGSFLAHLKLDRTVLTDARLSLFQVGIGLTRR